MNMTIISGLSGSGKTIALHTLEDIGFYCIDNLPVGLLNGFASEVRDQRLVSGNKVAVSIDARNRPEQLNRFPEIIAELKSKGTTCKILFLQADDPTLLKRFSETRRKHPLSGIDLPLTDAIHEERKLLAPIAANADLLIDTSHTNLHQLRDLVRECIGEDDDAEFSLLLRSFGYKHGIPADADLVFDARCLPNPHWQANLRNLTGLDKDVIMFLERETMVQELYNHLEQFLSTWIPRFKADNRSYLSIAIGCTGGQHRSVYLVNKLATSLGKQAGDVVVRHRELE
ncbi:MAG: RNase adapter RapZ [Gammaproteobacteria bacterium]|nr:RNase adapter RapZ [Gammaproteobacteria bacterium]